MKRLVERTLEAVAKTYGKSCTEKDIYELGDTLEKAVRESVVKIDPSLQDLFCDVIMGLGSDKVGCGCADLPQATIAAREITEIYFSLASLDEAKKFLEKAREYAFNRTSAFRERTAIKEVFQKIAQGEFVSDEIPKKKSVKAKRPPGLSL